LSGLALADFWLDDYIAPSRRQGLSRYGRLQMASLPSLILPYDLTYEWVFSDGRTKSQLNFFHSFASGTVLSVTVSSLTPLRAPNVAINRN